MRDREPIVVGKVFNLQYAVYRSGSTSPIIPPNSVVRVVHRLGRMITLQIVDFAKKCPTVDVDAWELLKAAGR